MSVHKQGPDQVIITQSNRLALSTINELFAMIESGLGIAHNFPQPLTFQFNILRQKFILSRYAEIHFTTFHGTRNVTVKGKHA